MLSACHLPLCLYHLGDTFGALWGDAYGCGVDVQHGRVGVHCYCALLVVFVCCSLVGARLFKVQLDI